jgi:hypothetical protein
MDRTVREATWFTNRNAANRHGCKDHIKQAMLEWLDRFLRGWGAILTIFLS